MEKINDSNFGEKTAEGLTLVDFWADWCMPCKMIAPVLEELDKEMDVKFAKLNVDENPKTATKFSVSGIPTLIIFKDGEEVDRIVGMASKEDLKNRIDGHK